MPSACSPEDAGAWTPDITNEGQAALSNNLQTIKLRYLAPAVLRVSPLRILFKVFDDVKTLSQQNIEILVVLGGTQSTHSWENIVYVHSNLSFTHTTYFVLSMLCCFELNYSNTVVATARKIFFLNHRFIYSYNWQKPSIYYFLMSLKRGFSNGKSPVTVSGSTEGSSASLWSRLLMMS